MAIKTVNTPKEFVDACQKANIPPTKRQYKKYQNKKGLAYATRS